jgi:hypothetical protein
MGIAPSGVNVADSYGHRAVQPSQALISIIRQFVHRCLKLEGYRCSLWLTIAEGAYYEDWIMDPGQTILLVHVYQVRVLLTMESKLR